MIIHGRNKEMGGQRSYLESGGFSEYLYHQVGETITANGISGKVIEPYGNNLSHSGLPQYSNTSNIYFKLDDKTGKIEQARVYDGRKVAYDFDWGHTHKEYNAGIVHVHEWHKNSSGNWVRSSKPRGMNNDEIKKYGPLLKKANSEVRLR
jgi:hypothetical protein